MKIGQRTQSQGKEDIKRCLKSLCHCIELTFGIELTPEALRRSKFNKLEEKDRQRILSLLKKLFSSTMFDGNVPFSLSFESTDRVILLTFGYFLTTYDLLSLNIFNQIKLAVVGFRSAERFQHQLATVANLLSGDHLDLGFTEDNLFVLSLLKRELRLCNNESTNFILNSSSMLEDLEIGPKLASNIFVQDSSSRNQFTNSKVKRLVNAWFEWQLQLPVFIDWLSSAVDLEYQDLEQKIELVVSEVLCSNYLQYLHLRISYLTDLSQNLKAKLDQYVPKMSKPNCSNDVLAKRIDAQKSSNKVKIQKLFSKLDSRVMLVANYDQFK